MSEEKKESEQAAEALENGEQPRSAAAEDEEGAAVDLSAFGGTLVHGDEDYESRFMKDALQRAHDRELAALANLALIRSNSDERNMLLMTLEREQAMSPREVNRRLKISEGENKQQQKK